MSRFRPALLWLATMSYPAYLIADRLAHAFGFCLGQ
jgi:hypothetical protein